MNAKILPILVSIALLVGLIYYSGASKVISLFLRANPVYVVLGLLLWFVGAIIRSARWRYLLSKFDHIPFSKVLHVFIPGLFLSNLTPAKVGEPIRCFLLQRVSKIGVSKSLPSILIEKMLDVITMILISLIGILLLVKISVIYLWLGLAILIYGLVFSVAIYILLSKKRTEKILSLFFSLFSFLPFVRQLKTKVKGFSKTVGKSLKVYRSERTIITTKIYTIFIWIIEGVILFLAFKSLGLEVTILSTIVILAITALLSVLTLLPGSLGSAEIISALLFTSIFPLSLAEVTAAVLLARFLSFWMYALVGSILLPTLK
ncbi:MAG: flippase-like domain-containing protein [Candidatus Aenigmarchaeota archaeon]|nr:flippase-like domain-containing protein [Candidatus Aenigmarchaeota archaeon]